MRVSSGAITSSWHKVEIGIITGCTISVTFFSLAMNMLTKSAEPEGPAQIQPPIRAFMDDLTVMPESVPGCRWILKGLEELVEWARMRFKPAKSRSMVLRKGKVVDKIRFNIADTAIPSISEKPVKSLGKVLDCSLRDTTSIQSTCTELDGWLKSVDKDPQAQTQSHRDHPVVGAYRVKRTVRLCIKDRTSPFPPYQYVVQLTQHTRSSVMERPSLASRVP
ncbi:hypothetical protein NHX12_003744 [Muraenolepis orangiensis]|uniref:Reverse transcriptase domain-containing protein n=1 Tax=Muraenolepis orangiensis TaxID=630683 RepID=A0A9Q0DXQ2_9TELE|nr:hypothetical protein NHX12_003744 [Muraenolepis orangiensis]